MESFVAALPMYDWPEERAETDRAWVAIANELRTAGIAPPERLARRNADLPPVPGGVRDASGSVVAPDPATLPPDGFDLFALWTHPALLLAQTCWGPLEMGLAGAAVVVGQPDYSSFEGGEGELYSSAILMRDADAPRPGRSWIDLVRGTRLAFNGPDSMSGLLALARDLEAAGESMATFPECVETGSHRASIIAVAEGRADVCAIDCRTWHLAQRHEPAAARLRPVGWTAKRKGLPFITSRHTPPATVDLLRALLQLPERRGSSG